METTTYTVMKNLQLWWMLLSTCDRQVFFFLWLHLLDYTCSIIHKMTSTGVNIVNKQLLKIRIKEDNCFQPSIVADCNFSNRNSFMTDPINKIGIESRGSEVGWHKIDYYCLYCRCFSAVASMLACQRSGHGSFPDPGGFQQIIRSTNNWGIRKGCGK